jgi:hypothetical protein
VISDARPTLIDWELAGYAASGYDEALLWTVLMDDRRARDVVAGRMEDSGKSRMRLFAINRLAILAREIHIHRIEQGP